MSDKLERQVVNPFLCNNCFYSMCYFFYKNGKNKQSSISTQRQSVNHYSRQPGGSSTNSVTVNQSYGTHIVTTPSFDEDPPQAMYEDMNMR